MNDRTADGDLPLRVNSQGTQIAGAHRPGPATGSPPVSAPASETPDRARESDVIHPGSRPGATPQQYDDWLNLLMTQQRN
jgi:hypothetical protein